MSDVSLSAVGVSYGTTEAVRDVSLDLASGQRLAILGPSGCGKSSLLRVVAGLEPLESGRVAISGQDQANIPTFKRGVGLMFQDHALFPHLDVAGNVAFGLRMARWPGVEIRTRVSEMLELVGLSAYSDAQVGDLSGGEQQRVALARTLAPRPKVVLLDEPLGSLDRVMRQDLMDTMTEVFDSTGATVIFVTHDQSEAFALGHQVAVMRSGRFQQLGSARELWTRPVDAWVAHFLGLTNIFPAQTRILGAHATPRHEFLLRPDLLRIEGLESGGTSGPEASGTSGGESGGKGDSMAAGARGPAAGAGDRPTPGFLGEIPGAVVATTFRGGYSAVKVAVLRSNPAGIQPATSGRNGNNPGNCASNGERGKVPEHAQDTDTDTDTEHAQDTDAELEVWVLGDPPRVGQRVVVSVPAAAVLELGSD